MVIRYALREIFRRKRRTLLLISGISLGVVLFVSIVSIMQNTQRSFASVLDNIGADMIVQLQGEPCVWSQVKLPTNLNPIAASSIDKIKKLSGVKSVSGILICWAFSEINFDFSSFRGPELAGGGGPPEGGHVDGEVCPIERGSGPFCDFGGGGGMDPFVIQEVIKKKFHPIVVSGIDINNKEFISVTQGNFFSKDNANEAIVDKDFAKISKVEPSAEISLGFERFKVIGIADLGKDARIAGAQVFIPLKIAQRMVNRGEIVDTIFVRLSNKANIKEVQTNIREIIGKEATITTSEDYLRTAGDLSLATRTLTIGVFAIIAFIALLFVIKSIYGFISERATEIGLMKAVGWQDKEIAWLMLVEHGIIGLVAGLLGGIFGFGLAYLYQNNILIRIPYILNPYPPCSTAMANTVLKVSSQFSFLIFIDGIILAVIINVIFGYLISKKIMKLMPAEAMRKL